MAPNGLNGQGISIEGEHWQMNSPSPSQTSKRSRRDHVRAWLAARMVTLTRVYFTWLFGWAILHGLFGDRWWWLFLLNTFAEYLFLPLPAILLMALVVRRRETWIGLGIAVALGGYLYGGLFLPPPPWRPTLPPNSPTLTVMSYNILGFNEHPEAVVAAIRSADVDLVVLQELNPPAATAIQRELADEYPYQVLDPQEGVTGAGAISRYPLHPTGETLPGRWVGTPQILTLEFRDDTITILSFHTYATNFATLLSAPETIEWTVQERERQTRTAVEYVRAHPGPLIAPVDFNAGDQSRTWALITEVLSDSWREAGRGLGHTFPGADSPGSSRYSLGPIPVPMWMLRIDYVFHSPHWQATSARIGPWDGVSDHRPVIAELALTGRNSEE